MKTFFLQIKSFFLELYNDRRIPEFDKKIVITIFLFLAIRILFIPDWIPYELLAPLEIFIMLALIFDYFFNVLDHNLLLSHYPWSMKSFTRFQRIGRFMAFFIPAFISDNLWKYIRDPF